MNRDANRPAAFWTIALVGLLLAWAVDLLFWRQSPGLSYPIWVALAVAALFGLAFWQRRPPALAAYPLALASLLLATTVYLRSEPFSVALATLLSLALLALLAATLTSGHWWFYRLGDYAVAALRLLGAALVRSGQALWPGAGPAAQGAEEPAPPSSREGLRKALPFLRGVLLALPVLAVLAGLLASADPLFARLLKDFLAIFKVERSPEYLFRLVYVLGLAYVLSGVLLHALFPQPAEPRPDPRQSWAVRFLGATEALVVLSSVVALFALFVVMQVRYLFGGQANITAEGFTYADYARRGFFELVWVAVLSLGLQVGLGAITRRERAPQALAFRVLSTALLALVLVILASAYQRLALYEAAYGFTRLRTYTHIFIPWLGLLLAAAVLLLAIDRPGRLGLAMLLVLTGFGLTFTVLDVDGLIARQNVQRALAGEELDAAHLVSLSAGAVPALAAAFQDPAVPEALRSQLGAVLACQHAALVTPVGWRSARLAESRASALLGGLQLPTVKADPDTRIRWVPLPGRSIYCTQYAWD